MFLENCAFDNMLRKRVDNAWQKTSNSFLEKISSERTTRIQDGKNN